MEFLQNVAGSTILVMFLLATCVAIEYLGPIERYSLRDRLPGIIINCVGGALTFALIWPVKWVWSAMGVAPFITIPLWDWLEPLGDAGLAIQAAVLVVVADFLAYWRHRAEHSWFWRVHVVHHAPRELHAANSIGHPIQALFSFAFIAVPMSLIQISGPTIPFVVGAVVSLLALYIHSPTAVNFGAARRIVVDNRFHRIHHSLEERHFDKNFGICFSIWDYMFGTAYEPGEEWPEVGVAGVRSPMTLTDYLKLPFLPEAAGSSAEPGPKGIPATES
ncbi:sterol desaturase family protein [Sphingomonas daechungensis]|uniref:sterol desaturase family protein n=1 Tax=Sphingomonas daechungensis TaxID=1176646 RepID=UPI0037833240